MAFNRLDINSYERKYRIKILEDHQQVRHLLLPLQPHHQRPPHHLHHAPHNLQKLRRQPQDQTQLPLLQGKNHLRKGRHQQLHLRTPPPITQPAPAVPISQHRLVPTPASSPAGGPECWRSGGRWLEYQPQASGACVSSGVRPGVGGK